MKKILLIFIISLMFLLPHPVVFGQTATPSSSSQAVSLKFRINGIGKGGNEYPLNKKRDVMLHFYNPDIKADDPSVKPLYSVPVTAEYDSDPDSSNFGSFINSKIFLEDSVPLGRYQIVVDTDKTLPKLVKVDAGSIGGTIFEVRNSRYDQIIIEDQVHLPGDIYPAPLGDGKMDINDYYLLESCFGVVRGEIDCSDKSNADLDDNGSLDGIDYNLMFVSFNTLSELGFPVPSFSPTVPTEAVVTLSVTPESTDAEEKEQETQENSSGSGGLIAAIILSLLALVVSIVVVMKRKRVKGFLTTLLGKLEKGKKDTEKTPDEGGEEKIDKDFFVKKQTFDEENKVNVLTLTDDTGPTLGYFKGEVGQDGFARVKGVLKKEGNKVYVEVVDIKPVESSQV
jgi:hypothetical protein